jgi:hypothetical protein
MSRLQPLAGVTLQQPIGPMLSANPRAAPYGLKRSDAAQIPATARKPLQHRAGRRRRPPAQARQTSVDPAWPSLPGHRTSCGRRVRAGHSDTRCVWFASAATASHATSRRSRRADQVTVTPSCRSASVRRCRRCRSDSSSAVTSPSQARSLSTVTSSGLMEMRRSASVLLGTMCSSGTSVPMVYEV